MFSFTTPSSTVVAKFQNGSNKKMLYLHEGVEEEDQKKGFFKRLQLDDGILQIMPETRPNMTDRIAIIALSGSGKSTFINNYIREFFKLFEDSDNVILFTRQNEEDFDKAFDEHKDKIDLMTLDDDILENPIDLSLLPSRDSSGDYKPQLIIFDDYEGLPHKVKFEVDRMRNDISMNGRKLGLYLICAQVAPDLKTPSFRDFLSNTTHFVTFPKKCTSNTKYALETYFDVTPRVWKKIKDQIGNKWFLITRQGTPMMMCDSGAIIFDSEEIDDKVKLSDRIKQRAVVRDSLETLPYLKHQQQMN